jgi:hypothetical protein
MKRSSLLKQRVNLHLKSFMRLADDVHLIKLFWCNLCCYRHIALSTNSGYNTRGVNYADKSLIKSNPLG